MPANEHGCPSKRYFVLRGVNGPHAVVVAPVLIRLDILRKGSTYELLITQHQPSSAGNGTRPRLESKVLFRGVHGRLELSHPRQDMGRVGTVLPSFCSRSGEGIGIPKRFRSVVHALTVAVNSQGCEHRHYTTVRQNNDISRVNLPNEKDKHATEKLFATMLFCSVVAFEDTVTSRGAIPGDGSAVEGRRSTTGYATPAQSPEFPAMVLLLTVTARPLLMPPPPA